MPELKPCPFCGSVARLYVMEEGVCVKCTNLGCKCQTPWHSDAYINGLSMWAKDSKGAVGRAIEEWNRRATDE